MPWPGILNRLWHQLNVTKFSFERRVCSSATLPRGFTCVRGLVLCSAELSARVACAELFVRLLRGASGLRLCSENLGTDAAVRQEGEGILHRLLMENTELHLNLTQKAPIQRGTTADTAT